MDMTFEKRRRGIINIIYIQTTLCTLLSIFMASHGTETDIFCLKSIKDSLEDPYGYLSSSWHFSNKTEGFMCRFNGVECWHPDENRVLNLKLSGMGLKGQFPRAIQNCSALIGLDLSLNELSGPIPSDISTLIRFATSIDLSNNKFSGDIPASFGNCSYLNSLKLDNNMLSGKIPQELGRLTRLKSISFVNNHLSGPMPEFRYGSGTDVSYANNTGLCGGPLPPCSSGKGFHKSFKFKDGLITGFAFSFTSVVVVYMSYCSPWTQTQLKQTKNNRPSKATKLGKYICSIIGRKSRIEANQVLQLLSLQLQEEGSTKHFSVAHIGTGFEPTNSSVEMTSETRSHLPPCSLDNGFHQSFKDGLIAGLAFSVTCVIVAYMYSYTPWTQLKNAINNHQNKARELGKYIYYIMVWKMRIVANQIHELLPLQLQGKGRKMITLLMKSLTSTMGFDELNDATDCFSIDNAIGVGEMGIMYEAMFPNGWHLAVKRLLDPQLFGRQALLEIRILSKLRHRNIVPLLGFCVEGKERIMVYQYMPNGRLSKWLHPLKSEVMRLAWSDRIKIALGVARALSWLHHTSNLHIVHRNICSKCILLDKNFEPKVSNFGEAKFMNLDNENDLGKTFYVKDGKKDVYDFGSVLFELVTGKTLNELSCSSTTHNLSNNPSNIFDAIDKSLIGKGFENEVFTLIKIACECAQSSPDQRPTMLRVYNNMSNIWEGRHGFSDDSDMPRQSEIVSATDSDEIVEL